MLKMHWLFVRSSMIKIIPLYRELGFFHRLLLLGIVVDDGLEFRFFCLFCCVFILPAVGGAKAEQAPVFHLKAKQLNKKKKTVQVRDDSARPRSPAVVVSKNRKTSIISCE